MLQSLSRRAARHLVAVGEVALPRRRALALCVLLAVIALACQAAAGSAIARDPADRAVVERLRGQSPHDADLLEQGEALASKGSFDPALALFQEGRADQIDDGPVASLFGRRECEALTSLGKRAEAARACWRAMQSSRTMPLIAAAVRALVTGPVAPTFAEVNQAMTLLSVERRKGSAKSPNLEAAMCDVAESIGDGVMLQRCANELEQIAPNYEPTRRARAALDARCPPWRFWSGWLIVVALSAATAWDSLRRMARRGARSAQVVAVATALLAAFLAFSPDARADLPPAPPGAMLSMWPVDDKDPSSSIPTDAQKAANPLQFGYWLQDVIYKAQIASKHGLHEDAVKYYKALFKAVPERATSPAKLCDEYDAMGKTDEAIASCGTAMLLDGVTVNDFAHYVRLVLRRPGPLSEKDTLELTNVIDHLKSDDIGHDAGIQLQCELATRTSNVAKLTECTAALAASAPDDRNTLTYEWALALENNKFGQARDFLAKAKAAGVKDDKIENMRRATDVRRSRWLKSLALGLGGVLALAGAAALGIQQLKRLRRRAVAAPAPA